MFQQSHPASLLRESSPFEANSLGAVVSRMEGRIDSVELKISSLTNVVKLLQKYTETKDDQYEKEKEQELFQKTIGARMESIEDMKLEGKLKQFQSMAKTLKVELARIEKYRGIQFQSGKDTLEDRLRGELNKKIEVCMKFLNSCNERENRLQDTVEQISSNMNRLENQFLRHKMIVEKEVDLLQSKIYGKGESTMVSPGNRNVNGIGNITSPAVRNITSVRDTSPVAKNDFEGRNAHQLDRSEHSQKSTSQNKGKRSKNSRNSRSQRSVSPLKQVSAVSLKDAKKVKDEELREAIRRKREHRDRLKAL